MQILVMNLSVRAFIPFISKVILVQHRHTFCGAMRISKLFLSTLIAFGFAKLQTPDIDVFCEAIKNVAGELYKNLISPVNVQILSKQLGNCIKLDQISFVMNFRTNTTSAITKSALLFVDNVEAIQDNYFESINHRGHHLVALRDHSPEILDTLALRFWKNRLINVNFLILQNSSAVLQTFMPYNEAACNDTRLRTINRFDEKARKWESSLIFPEKLANFNRCPVTISTYKNVVPYIVRDEFVKGTRVLKGRVIEVINALAQTLNFSSVIDYDPSILAWESCFQKVAERKSDIFIGNVFLELPRSKYLDYTIPIFFEFVKFMVPPGRSLSELEKLSKTFDTVTWILFAVVVVIAFVAVLVVTFQPRHIKILAFGANFNSAFMDLLSIIIGGSQMVLPVNNFCRIVITNLVIFCLVLRSLYQGSLFTFLQTDVKEKEVQSIDEMFERKFNFYLIKTYFEYLDVTAHKHSRYLNELN